MLILSFLIHNQKFYGTKHRYHTIFYNNGLKLCLIYLTEYFIYFSDGCLLINIISRRVSDEKDIQLTFQISIIYSNKTFSRRNNKLTKVTQIKILKKMVQ